MAVNHLAMRLAQEDLRARAMRVSSFEVPSGS